MKKAVRRYLVAGAVVLAVGVLAILAARPPEKPPEPPVPQETESTTAPPRPVATLGVWEGKLAVFRREGAPPQVLDVYIRTLPPAEQEALTGGIPVYSEEALAGLLEDYTG